MNPFYITTSFIGWLLNEVGGWKRSPQGQQQPTGNEEINDLISFANGAAAASSYSRPLPSFTFSLFSVKTDFRNLIVYCNTTRIPK